MRLVIASAFATLLFGCEASVEPPSAESAQVAQAQLDIVAELSDVAFPAVLANEIAKRCRSLTLNRPKFRALETETRQQLEAAGVSERRASTLVKTPELAKPIQAKMVEWVERRDVLLTDRNAFCVAGSKEIDEGTAIGSYLLR